MFESPSKTSVGLNPTLPEPWEAARVEVAPSKLPQGGEGLFAKTAIKVPGTRFLQHFKMFKIQNVL